MFILFVLTNLLFLPFSFRGRKRAIGEASETHLQRISVSPDDAEVVSPVHRRQIVPQSGGKCSCWFANLKFLRLLGLTPAPFIFGDHVPPASALFFVWSDGCWALVSSLFILRWSAFCWSCYPSLFLSLVELIKCSPSLNCLLLGPLSRTSTLLVQQHCASQDIFISEGYTVVFCGNVWTWGVGKSRGKNTSKWRDDSGGKIKFKTNICLFEHFCSSSAEWVSSTCWPNKDEPTCAFLLVLRKEENKIAAWLGDLQVWVSCRNTWIFFLLLSQCFFF